MNGDLNVNRNDVYSSMLSVTLYTRLRPLRLVTGERDDVSEQGLHFPTKPTQLLKRFQTHYLEFSAPRVPIPDQGQRLYCYSPWDDFVLVPANPGHFKVPYQLWKRCTSASAVQDRKKSS